MLGAGVQHSLIRELIQFIAAPKFQLPFERFFIENCLSFEDGEEQQLEYTVIYKRFQTLFDELLEGGVWRCFQLSVCHGI